VKDELLAHNPSRESTVKRAKGFRACLMKDAFSCGVPIRNVEAAFRTATRKRVEAMLIEPGPMQNSDVRIE